MSRFFKACLLLLMTLTVANGYDVIFKCRTANQNASLGGYIKNLPYRIYFTGANAMSDNVKDSIDNQKRYDKIGYTDANGMLSIKFYKITPLIASNVVVIAGFNTAMESADNHGQLTFPNDTVTRTVNLDDQDTYSWFNGVNFGSNVIIDSLKVTGSVIDDETEMDIAGAHVKVFFDSLSGKDTATVSTDSKGKFSFPLYKNSNLQRKVYLSVTNAGYDDADSIKFFGGILWDGINDTIKANFRLVSGDNKPKTDSLIVNGTVVDYKTLLPINGAHVKICYDSLMGIDTVAVSADPSGKFSLPAKLITDKLKKITFSISYAGYIKIDSVKSIQDLTIGDTKNDTIKVDFNLKTVPIKYDTLIVKGLISLDNAPQVGVRVKLCYDSLQKDSTVVMTNTSGIYSFFARQNSDSLKNIYISISKAGITKDTVKSIVGINNTDGIKDTINIDFNLKTDTTKIVKYDSLIVKGIIIVNKVPQNGVRVKVCYDSLRKDTAVVMTNASGEYSFPAKLNNDMLKKVYWSISKSGQGDSMTKSIEGVNIKDGKNDTITINYPPSTPIMGNNNLFAIKYDLTGGETVLAYNLNGRLIQSYTVSHSGFYSEVISKLQRNKNITKGMVLVQIKGPNGIFHKENVMIR